MPNASLLALALALALTAQPLAAAVGSLMADYARPGMPDAAVLVVRDGQVALAKGDGLADVEARVPVRPETSGFTNAVLRYPGRRLAVWVLTNRAGGAPWTAAQRIADRYLGQPAPQPAADAEALRAAYRTFEASMRAGSLAPAAELLAPTFEHRSLDANGGVRVTPRERFVARLLRPRPATDTVAAFTITVTDVAVRGDSADVAYREFVDYRRGAARDTSTSWWRDRWVRTPAGWRALRFEEVAPPTPVRKDR